MSTKSKFACSFYCSFCIESQSPRTGALPKSQFKEMNAIYRYKTHLEHQLTLLVVHTCVGHHRLAELLFHIFQFLLKISNILIESVLGTVGGTSPRIETSIFSRSSDNSIYLK